MPAETPMPKPTFGKNQETVVMQRAWQRAHPNIIRIAYGVLVLLTCTSVMLSIYRERLSAAVISIVVVTALCFVVLGLNWIASRKEKFWRITGNVFITATLAGIVALFLTILIYIAIGYPVWMDVWFGPKIQVDPPVGVSVSAIPIQLASTEQFGGADSQSGPTLIATKMARNKESNTRNVVREEDGSFKVKTDNMGPSVAPEYTAGGMGLVRSRRSQSMIAPIASYVRRIHWSKDVLADVDMEISLSKRGEDNPFLTIVVDGQAGLYNLEGLVSQTYYDYRITAIRKGRKSSPISGCFATPLDYYVVEPQPNLYSYITYYSANWNCEGVIQDENGEIIYEAFEYFNKVAEYRSDYGLGVARWIYRGAISNGKPTWNGILYADPVDCVGDDCGTACDFSPTGGSEGLGACVIFYDGISVKEVGNSSREISYVGAQSEYEGTIQIGDGKAEYSLGPIGYRFDQGVLEAVDAEYRDLYFGNWLNGTLQVIKNADRESLTPFRRGKLLWGKSVAISDCLVAVTPVDGKTIKGAGFKATCGSIEIGEFRGNVDPYNGFRADYQTGSSVHFFRNGNHKVFSPPRNIGHDECKQHHNFGLQPSADWSLSCNQGQTCTISNRQTDTTLEVSVQENQLPRVVFRSPQNGEASDVIKVDGAAYDVAPRSSNDGSLSGLAVLAQMCSGKEYENTTYDEAVTLEEFCQTAAVAFARLVGCNS